MVKIKRKGTGYRFWELPGSPEDWRFFEVPERNKIKLRPNFRLSF
jgi:hypothetical protein